MWFALSRPHPYLGLPSLHAVSTIAVHVYGAHGAGFGACFVRLGSGLWLLPFLFRLVASWPSVLSAFVTTVSLVGLRGRLPLVPGRLNYWVLQAVLRRERSWCGVRAHDVRKFAFSVNSARRADLSHILSYEFWAITLRPVPSILPSFVAAGSVVVLFGGGIVMCVGTPVLEKTCSASASPVSYVKVFSDKLCGQKNSEA